MVLDKTIHKALDTFFFFIIYQNYTLALCVDVFECC